MTELKNDLLKRFPKLISVTIRNRKGKLYMTVKGRDMSYEEFLSVKDVVKRTIPGCYTTSAGGVSATYRLI